MKYLKELLYQSKECLAACTITMLLLAPLGYELGFGKGYNEGLQDVYYRCIMKYPQAICYELTQKL